MDSDAHPISKAFHDALLARNDSCVVDIGKLREACSAAPDDRENRARLLGALWFSARRDPSPEAVDELVWWIQRHPRDLQHVASALHMLSHAPYSAYQTVRDAWTAVLATHGDEPDVALAAAQCFAHHESDRALALLARAHETAANDARPARAAGHIWRLRAMRYGRRGADHDRAAATEALRWFERALEREPSPCCLDDASEAALAAGELERARFLAERLVTQAEAVPATWSTGNAIYTGHSILGQVALHDGEIERAKEHLKLAGQTPGSPQLNSFGPELELADALLQRGEREAVVAFLRDVERFWSGRGRIELWCHEIEVGQTPRLRRFGFD